MEQKYFSKHLIEIRYKPNPRFIDKKGEIADILTAGSFFDEWSISNNKIDFINKQNKDINAFFSFRNIGLFSSYPNPTSLFQDESKEFIKSAWDLFLTNRITRIGIRSTYLIEVKNFKILFDQYRKKFLGLSNEDLQKFGGDLIDIGFPLNFSSGEDFFNITTGPMQKEQSRDFVINHEELPDSGVFIDVDYFKKEFSPHVTQKNILDFIDKGINKSDDIKKLIANLTIKDN